MTQRDLIYDAITSETDDCILWPFGTTDKGYPRYIIDKDGERKRVRAHRFVCAKTHGNPPDLKSQVAHSCGVRLCINPRHLRWTTARDNTSDMLIHGTRGGYLNMENPKII